MRPIRRIHLALIAVAALLLALFLPSLFSGRPGDGPSPADPPPTGRVVSADGSPAPAGTRVVAHGPDGPIQVRADSGGAFRLEPLPDGVLEVEAVAGPLRARASIGEGAGDGRLEIRLPGKFDVSGKVVSGEEGGAVAGAEVRCGGLSGTTDDRGRFKIEDVPAPTGGPATIEIRAAEHMPRTLAPPPGAAWDDLFIRLIRRR